MMSQVLSPSRRSASFNSIDSNRMRLGLTFVYSNNAFCLEKETDLVVSEDTHAGVQSQAAEPWNIRSHHGSPPLPKCTTARPDGLRGAIALFTARGKLLAALVTPVLALCLDPPGNWRSCLRAVNHRDAANEKSMKEQVKRTG